MPVSPWRHIEPNKETPPFLLPVSEGRPTLEQQLVPLQRHLSVAEVLAIVHEAKGRADSPLHTDLGVEGDASTQVLTEFLARNLGRGL